MKKIAVIGSGISGLVNAYLLSKKHQVTVYEKNNYIGGHTATVDIEYGGQAYAIDTGFIVFNDRTYPNFLALLSQLGVDKQATEMSFSVRNCQSGLEYNGHNLNTLFAQRRNVFSPKFIGLVREILRFNRLCKDIYHHNRYRDAMTLGQFLTEQKFSQFFAEHYILPMGAAIWSSSIAQMEAFEFKFFVQFFYHHGLLNVTDRPQWYVIPGGSKNYIPPLVKPFEERIHLNSHITEIKRVNDKIELYFDDNSMEVFDELVLACHSDQALALLADPTEQERQILSAMPYRANDVVLHTDERLLPKRKLAWASWNYQLNQDRSVPASVTYNMNILQGIKSDTTFCVTLNQRHAIAEEKIIKSFTYHHPVFSVTSLAAQQQRSLICGKNHTHFAGAYWYNGFHEDGVKSAVDIANRFDCSLEA
ncbi:NAD(P)/FAD-dependent oxidoreductase [Thalassotalea ganghwensis]